MASLVNKIIVTSDENRPCLCDSFRCVFHKFSNDDMGIVEFEDGSIGKIPLENIHFTDDRVKWVWAEGDYQLKGGA